MIMIFIAHFVVLTKTNYFLSKSLIKKAIAAHIKQNIGFNSDLIKYTVYLPKVEKNLLSPMIFA